VRELRNVIERVMILEDGDLITTDYLPRGFGADGAAAPRAEAATPAKTEAPAQGVSRHVDIANRFRLPPEGVVLDDVEMSLVRQALERSNGNQTRAAELLGISRDQLRYRLKKLDDTSTA